MFFRQNCGGCHSFFYQGSPVFNTTLPDSFFIDKLIFLLGLKETHKMADEERPTRCGQRRSKSRRDEGDDHSIPSMHSRNAAEQAVQLFGSPLWNTPKRATRQTVPFSMTEPVWLTTAGGGGCCITDLQFPVPSGVVELSFQNFYAATIDILVCKPAPANAASAAAAVAAAEALRNVQGDQQRPALPDSPLEEGVEPGSLVPVGGKAGIVDTPMSAGKGKGEGAAPGLEPDTIEFLRSLGLDLDPATGYTASWEVSVRKKQLMPFPHFEMGSQDRFSVLDKESLCPWSELLAMRLLLRQPSPSWTVFGVSSVVAYRDAPPDVPARNNRRKDVGKHPSSDGAEGDGPGCALLEAVRRQTEAALSCGPDGGPREDRRGQQPHHHGHHRHNHAGYEFFLLPKV